MAFFSIKGLGLFRSNLAEGSEESHPAHARGLAFICVTDYVGFPREGSTYKGLGARIVLCLEPDVIACIVGSPQHAPAHFNTRYNGEIITKTYIFE